MSTRFVPFVGAGLLVAAGLAFAPATALAADRTWTGGEADFSTNSLWNPQPTSGWGAADRAVVNNGGIVVISSSTLTLTELWAGSTGTNTGAFRQTGGAITATDGIVIGRQGTAQGTYRLLGGALDVRNLRVGGGSSTASGTLEISGSETKLTSGISNEVSNGLRNGFVSIGSPGTGYVTLSNGATWEHKGTAYFAVGSDNNTPAATGGTGELTVESGAKLDITGSSTGRNLFIGKNSGATGTVTISGAGSEITLGADGSVVLGGTNNDGPNPGAGGYGTGTLNLNGGTVTAASIVKGTGGTATVNFDGGTIKASAANANFFGSSTGLNTAAIPAASLNVKSGGLAFDTAGFAVGITQGLSGAGGLTKIGAGTLTLSGANAWSGATIVSGGTLALGASNVLPDTALHLNSATLALGGFSDTLGLLVVGGVATVDFGSLSGPSILAFADSSSATWSGTLTLLNFDVLADTLSFSDSGGLTQAQLGSIVLGGYHATGLDAQGIVQFAAVPEPAAYGLPILMLLAVTVYRRRRLT